MDDNSLGCWEHRDTGGASATPVCLIGRPLAEPPPELVRVGQPKLLPEWAVTLLTFQLHGSLTALFMRALVPYELHPSF